MAEDQWSCETDPLLMLHQVLGSATDRKLRLFGCACCRRVWPWLLDDRSRRAVVVAERYADGLAGAEERARAQAEAADAARTMWEAVEAARVTRVGPLLSKDWAAPSAAEAAARVVAPTMAEGPGRGQIVAVRQFVLQAAVEPNSASGEGLPPMNVKAELEEAVHCALLRDSFGPGPLPAPAVSPAVLAWHDNTVARLAAVIYDERHFADLPILSDALEEAGCTDAALLEHLRGPGPHVLGCWALDALLQKE